MICKARKKKSQKNQHGLANEEIVEIFCNVIVYVFTAGYHFLYLQGKIVYNNHFQNQKTIEIDFESKPGIYLMIIDSESEHSVSKLVVN